jgi:hypothetical protein
MEGKLSLNVLLGLLGARGASAGFERVSEDPSGVLIRPAGTIVTTGSAAWINLDGTATGWIAWSSCAALVLILTQLQAVAAAYTDGWRPPEPFYDADYNGVSVTVNGLSSAKRYRFRIQGNPNTVEETISVTPNGTGDLYATCVGELSWGDGARWYIAQPKPDKGFTAKGTIEPRTGGTSCFHGASSRQDSLTTYVAFSSGYTSRDFTTLTFSVGPNLTARTGHLTIIEESP